MSDIQAERAFSQLRERGIAKGGARRCSLTPYGWLEAVEGNLIDPVFATEEKRIRWLILELHARAEADDKIPYARRVIANPQVGSEAYGRCIRILDYLGHIKRFVEGAWKITPLGLEVLNENRNKNEDRNPTAIVSAKKLHPIESVAELDPKDTKLCHRALKALLEEPGHSLDADRARELALSKASNGHDVITALHRAIRVKWPDATPYLAIQKGSGMTASRIFLRTLPKA